MSILSTGTTAPDFTLTDKDGSKIKLSALNTPYTVIYFYPKDDTPGCTLEGQEFSSMIEDFRARNATVIGISGGSDKTKAKFCKKYGLSVTLLSDQDFSVAKRFGVFGEKQFMGRKFEGIFRTTFVLDKNRKVVRVFEAVKPEGHAKEVLAFLANPVSSTERGAKVRSVAASSAKPVSKKKPAKKAAVKKPAAKKSIAQNKSPKKTVGKKPALKPAKKAVKKTLKKSSKKK